MGICSTTYGDLVCRGCKRFAHEIDQWNGYADDQRRLVWERLYKLREGAVLAHVRIEDETLLSARAASLRVPEFEALSPANLAYEVIRRSLREPDLTAFGLAARRSGADTQALYDEVEGELYRRAVAQFERDFRVPAR
ncbi:MAG TPA: DUF1289 domain-containing protein [Pseudomonadales bacterium]